MKNARLSDGIGETGGKLVLTGELFPNLLSTPCRVNPERIPVKTYVRAMLENSGVSPAEIDCLELVPIEHREYCVECLRRWAVHGDLITVCFASILISPYCPGDKRKVGSDRMPRLAWERFPSYPVHNSYGPFDLRAVYYIRPDLRYRIDLTRSEDEGTKAKSDSLFAAGWLPPQSRKEGADGTD